MPTALLLWHHGEIDAFVAIGRHLHRRQLPVPRIYRYDHFSGWVFMEDVGDAHLQAVVLEKNAPGFTRGIYCKVLDILLRFSSAGIEGFDVSWTCQTASYDKPLILEKECAYFVNSFLRGYLGLDYAADEFESCFSRLADGALEGATCGLMHRDFQSRNILIFHGEPRIIDFQGARPGPVQYDMASLLIDPYVDLAPSLQDELVDYVVDKLSGKTLFEPKRFRKCYDYCKITRNLQMLGAFGYLSRVKGKRFFEQYIPPALKSLKRNLAEIDVSEISGFRKVVDSLDIGVNKCKR